MPKKLSKKETIDLVDMSISHNRIQSLKMLLNEFGTIIKLAEVVQRTYLRGGKFLICGNGGSACDAMHFAEELVGKYCLVRNPVPAMALGDQGNLTCIANDFGFEQVFSRQVEAFGKPQDLLIAISTSGNSKNIIEAVNTAKNKKIKTICLLGKNGGKLKGVGDYEIVIPSNYTSRIQEMHMMLLHIFAEVIDACTLKGVNE